MFPIEKQKFAFDGHLEMIEFVWDFTPLRICGSWDCWRVEMGVNFGGMWGVNCLKNLSPISDNLKLSEKVGKKEDMSKWHF